MCPCVMSMLDAIVDFQHCEQTARERRVKRCILVIMTTSSCGTLFLYTNNDLFRFAPDTTYLTAHEGMSWNEGVPDDID